MTTRPPAKIRVFAAVELPPGWRDRLAEVIADLKTSLPIRSVRWVRSEATHLTLKFYGDVPPEDLPALQAALQQAAAGASPLALEIGGLGVFPNLIRPRVIWAGVAGNLDGLTALQTAVEQASAALGYKPEARGYSPHLTIGRVNGSLNPQDRQKLSEILQRTSFGQFGAFTTETLSLMRSNLKPTGAVYTRLFAAPFGGPKN